MRFTFSLREIFFEKKTKQNKTKQYLYMKKIPPISHLTYIIIERNIIAHTKT